MTPHEVKAFILLVMGVSMLLMGVYFFTESPIVYVLPRRPASSQLLARIVAEERLPRADTTSSRSPLRTPSQSPPSFVLNTSRCFVPSFDPFDTSTAGYFSKEPPTCHESKTIILFDTKVLRNQTCPSLRYDELKKAGVNPDTLNCSYRELLRADGRARPDAAFKEGPRTKFRLGSCPYEELIWMECSTTSAVTYEQPLFLPKARPARAASTGLASAPSYNVIVLGIDALSRLNFLRQMNKTRQWLESLDGVVEMLGYNKIGENSGPNQIPLLTGVSYVPGLFDRVRARYFDNVTEFLWDVYRRHGFSTMFFEEQWSTGIFIHPSLKGFLRPPTDYWPRPLMQKVDDSQLKRVRGENLCINGHYAEKDYLRYLVDTLTLAKHSNPLFAYAWFSELSHDHLNGARRMDGDFVEFFTSLEKRCLLDDTVVLFISDHGSRLEEWRSTTVGRYEDMLPFFYAILPAQLVRTRPSVVAKLRLNSRRLVTVYDIYATLRELATPWMNATDQRLGLGVSLISDEVPENRSCSDAGINLQFCSCLRPVPMSVEAPLTRKFAEFAIRSLNDELASYKALSLCQTWQLDKIVDVALMEAPDGQFHVYRVRLEASPYRGIFEATAVYRNESFTLQSRIERLDWYSTQSVCAKGTRYERYCFCKE